MIGDIMAQSNNDSLFGSTAPSWGENGYESGPANHGARAFGNWQSDHAWDIFAPAGTPVYAITPGVVSRVKAGKAPTAQSKVYGDQISVKSSDGNPDIFYTHISSAVTSGQELEVGDLIGYIVAHTANKDMPTHVHIGIANNVSISKFVDTSGKLVMHQGGGPRDLWDDLVAGLGTRTPTPRITSTTPTRSTVEQTDKHKDMIDVSTVDKIVENLGGIDLLSGAGNLLQKLKEKIAKEEKSNKRSSPFRRSSREWHDHEPKPLQITIVNSKDAKEKMLDEEYEDALLVFEKE
jgi:hypothetical protein